MGKYNQRLYKNRKYDFYKVYPDEVIHVVEQWRGQIMANDGDPLAGNLFAANLVMAGVPTKTKLLLNDAIGHPDLDTEITAQNILELADIILDDINRQKKEAK